MIPSDKKIIRLPGFERIISEEELKKREILIYRIEAILGPMDKLVYLNTWDLEAILERMRKE